MMKTISNSEFPAYDKDDLVLLDEVAMADAFRDAIEYGKTYVGALLTDGRVIFVDVNHQALQDVFQLKNGFMYAGGAGALLCTCGNDRKEIIHTLSGKTAAEKRTAFCKAVHSL